VSQPRNGQQSLCEPHRAEIAALVDRGVAASVIFEELVGFTGGYSTRRIRRDGVLDDDVNRAG
jgi:hypothetical protein